MTPAQDRRHIAALIDEATAAGARLTAACAALGLSARTLQRWRDPAGGISEDRRPSAERPTPANTLSKAERDEIVATCNAPEFASLPPSQIVPRLADQGRYIASESSMYRVLRERGQNHRRGRTRPPSRSKPPASFQAKAPCQVWSWDITWLTMERLGVVVSFSRPRVSNDNPFSEALFRTCKYTPDWPTRGFATVEEARAWVQRFANWYNTEHRHSAIRFVTPDQRHRGEDPALLASRHQVYELARATRPERWSGRTRNWQPIASVWLNPERPDAGRRGHGAADALPHKAGGGGPMAGPAKNAA